MRPILRAGRETPEQRAAREANRAEYALELRAVEALRPKTRADCHRVRLAIVADLDDEDPRRVHRPCPFISCRYHLHADVDARGTITVYDDADIAHTCALDVIDEHPDGVTREEIAVVLRVSEERTRVYERAMERRLRAAGGLDGWRGHESARAEAVEERAD